MAAAAQDRPDVEVFREISQIDHLVRQSVSRRLPPGMAYAQYELLRIMAREGDGQTPAQLARAMLLTKGALTNILQRMEAAGHVQVIADETDRRKKRVRITGAGVAAFNTVVKGLKQHNSDLRSAFTDAEFRDAMPFLKALRTFLLEVRPDES